MNEQERARLGRAVTKLVENIDHWQNKQGVISLAPKLDKGVFLEFYFGSMPACESKGIIVGTYDIFDLEDQAGITKNSTPEDKALGIEMLVTSIETAIDEGDYSDAITAFLD